MTSVLTYNFTRNMTSVGYPNKHSQQLAELSELKLIPRGRRRKKKARTMKNKQKSTAVLAATNDFSDWQRRPGTSIATTAKNNSDNRCSSANRMITKARTLPSLNDKAFKYRGGSLSAAEQLSMILPPPPEPRKLPLLDAIKPQNQMAEKVKFMRSKFRYNPQFVYRNPADSDSLARFESPSNRYLKLAIKIMEVALLKFGTYEKFEELTAGRLVTRTHIMAAVTKYLQDENLDAEVAVCLSDDLLCRACMTRSKGKPTINIRITNLREQWLEGLLRHEIGTHYLRSANNRCQIWKSTKTRKSMGLLPWNPTEEGLASLHSVLLRKEPSLWRAAILYYTVHQAAYMSFKDLFKDLGQYVQDPDVRWDYCMRAKRGQIDTSLPGTFCKDQVYLTGALEILKNRHVIDFHLLTKAGKVSYKDLHKVKDMADLDNTRIPFFMADQSSYRRRLDYIVKQNGLSDEDFDEIE